jgi:hypothetical protein
MVCSSLSGYFAVEPFFLAGASSWPVSPPLLPAGWETQSARALLLALATLRLLNVPSV